MKKLNEKQRKYLEKRLTQLEEDDYTNTAIAVENILKDRVILQHGEKVDEKFYFNKYPGSSRLCLTEIFNELQKLELLEDEDVIYFKHYRTDLKYKMVDGCCFDIRGDKIFSYPKEYIDRYLNEGKWIKISKEEFENSVDIQPKTTDNDCREVKIEQHVHMQNGSSICIGDTTSEPLTSLTTTREVNKMTDTILKSVKSVVRVNDVDADKLTDQQLIDLIVATEQKMEELSKIKSKSKYVEAQLEHLADLVVKVTELLDARVEKGE